MKTEPALSRRAALTDATKACAHGVPAPERLHRARIAELNRTVRHDLIYYTEATIDRGMKELGGPLNNRLTFSTHACHGHRAPRVRRQDPYVVFRVLPGRGVEWRRLQRRVFTGLTRSLTGNTTLHVEDYCDLPHSAELFCWRFGPADRKRARKVFQAQRQWRRAVNRLISATCRILRNELAARVQRRPTRTRRPRRSLPIYL